MKQSRTGQQTQQEEDKDLHEACYPIKEVDKGLFPGEIAVAQHDAYDISTKVTIPSDQVRNSVGQYCNGENEQRIETFSFYTESIQYPGGYFRNKDAAPRSECKLGE